MSQVAKLFTNGRSQAVRLPAAFRFEGKEVFIRQDPETGDVILSRRPATWDDFFSALKEVDVPADFLGAEERRQETQERDPFERWEPGVSFRTQLRAREKTSSQCICQPDDADVSDRSDSGGVL